MPNNYDFYSWQETLAILPKKSPLTHPPDLFKTDYIYIDQIEQLPEIIPYLQASAIGIDCETSGLDPLKDEIRLLQLAIPDYPVLIIDQIALNEEKEYIQKIFTSSSLKIGHNLKFELQFLTRLGFKLSPPFFDTMLGYQVLIAGLKKNLVFLLSL
ncbi:hypothetical protein [Gloeothece verrucosa]|uniref:hypothetical protein n=1 Tax=Gloeothece verrucosa TaxID=2546359 RepID=UPI00017E2F5C|nr:hypothetical protein [Gloeothece verrucosa]